MERFIKWSSIFIVVFALVLCGLYWVQRPIPLSRNVSVSDEEYILMVLRQKAADDCVLTPVSPGVWSCKEFKTGKVFMVRR